MDHELRTLLHRRRCHMKMSPPWKICRGAQKSYYKIVPYVSVAYASCYLTRCQPFVAWNNVMAAILNVWRHIKLYNSFNQCIFTWRIFPPNFIPIRFETTEPLNFLYRGRVAPTRWLPYEIPGSSYLKIPEKICVVVCCCDNIVNTIKNIIDLSKRKLWSLLVRVCAFAYFVICESQVRVFSMCVVLGS